MLSKALIIFLVIFSFHLSAQVIVTEIKGEGKVKEGLRGFCRGDSLFLIYYDKDYPNSVASSEDFHTVWVMPDGTQINSRLKDLHKKAFIGATKEDDRSLYYYLEDEKKKIRLKALAQGNLTDDAVAYESDFLFTGKLLASYLENDFLFLLVAEKEELRLTKVKNLKVINTTSFSILPLDLSKDKKKQFNFVDVDKINRPGQFSNLGKVIKTPNALFVVVDDPADFHNEQQTSFKTAVIKLDLLTNSSTTKYFFEKSRSDFRTTVFGNKVFRYTDKKQPEVNIYEYLTGKLLKTQLAPAIRLKDSLLLTAGKVDISFFEKASNLKSFISVDSVDSKLVLSVGKEFEHDPVSVIPIPVFSLVNLAVFAGSVIAGDINDGQKSYLFYSLEGNVNTDFQTVNRTYLPNQKINIYEGERREDVKIKRRIYLSNRKRIFAIYQEAKNTDLKVLRFEK